MRSIDNVNKPSHYEIKDGLEVIDVREALLEKMEALNLPPTDVDDWSRAWEYITRGFFKNELEDFDKADYYLKRLRERMRKRTN